MRRIGKHLTEVEFKYIKELLSKDYSTKQVQNLANRASSTISVIRHSDTFEDYKIALQERSNRMVEVKTSSNGIYKKTLDEALDLLDKELENLKQAIEEVVMLSVEQKVADYKKEKETELTALKTVVEAAKANNLATTLKERLMGG